MMRSFIAIIFILLMVHSRSRDGSLSPHFSYLRVTQQLGGTKLEWRNTTEADIRLYAIERSMNGQDFSNAGVLSPTFNNGGIADYVFIDLAAPAGTSFYRIGVHE